MNNKKQPQSIDEAPKTLETKWGRANLQKTGYYLITSGPEEYAGKTLHRLIYEDQHGVTVLPWCVVHHKDNNKLNNNPDNLIVMTNSEHRRIHMLGKNNPNYGKKGKDHPSWKDYPTIRKKGRAPNNKQKYVLLKNSKVLKQSINIKDLIAFAKELKFPRVEVMGQMKHLK